MTDLSISTTIARFYADGDIGACDVLVYFRVTHFSPGYKGDMIDPPCGPEYEFDFVRAELDGHPEETPLTAAEIDDLTGWLYDGGGYGKAIECAEENHDDGPDPDEARDREYDRRMAE
jgi:hypothetical protein